MGSFIFGSFAFLILIVTITFICRYEIRERRRNRVNHISLGMNEDKMLKIMGKRYNKSLLKNNRVKYEWRYSNGISTGTSYRGVNVRKYSGVSKVDIYCKNCRVEEVRPYNI